MALGRLGCLDSLDVIITDQCGGPRICSLTNVASVAFNRVLDDISEAVVVVPLGSGVSNTKPCCDCLDLIEPWCHELHIIRNGEEVWTGPVNKVTYGYTQVTIQALDMLSWLLVRVPQGTLNNSDPAVAARIGEQGPMGGNEITDLALNVLETAFNEHDPCVLEFVYQTDLDYRPTIYNDTIVNAEQGFAAFEGTIYDWLTNLSELGLDFTVIGRRIILGVTRFNLPRLGTLVDEHILGEIELVKDGAGMANRVFVRFEQDTDAAQCAANNPQIPAPPCPAISEAGTAPGTENNAIDEVCYGPIERIFTDALGFNHTTAKQTADAYVFNGQFAPRTMSFPSGTRLSPDTPWTFNEMIPGTKIDVALDNLCLDVNQSMRIVEVNYALQVGGDEEIGLSLNTFNQIGGI